MNSSILASEYPNLFISPSNEYTMESDDYSCFSNNYPDENQYKIEEDILYIEDAIKNSKSTDEFSELNTPNKNIPLASPRARLSRPQGRKSQFYSIFPGTIEAKRNEKNQINGTKVENGIHDIFNQTAPTTISSFRRQNLSSKRLNSYDLSKQKSLSQINIEPIKEENNNSRPLKTTFTPSPLNIPDTILQSQPKINDQNEDQSNENNQNEKSKKKSKKLKTKFNHNVHNIKTQDKFYESHLAQSIPQHPPKAVRKRIQQFSNNSKTNTINTTTNTTTTNNNNNNNNNLNNANIKAKQSSDNNIKKNSKASLLPQRRLLHADYKLDENYKPIIPRRKIKGENIPTKIFYENGDTKTIFKNKTFVITHFRKVMTHFSNGDFLEQYPDGATAYKYFKDNTIELRLPDGSVYIEFANGQREKRTPSGDTSIFFQDGKEIKVSKDGGYAIRTKEGFYEKMEIPEFSST